ncbi:MAG: hypothetical protein E7231_13795 [Cellulosilyticum sp.]|nr:hypothetical protein [Cellulosilyticum sp.]
MDLQKRTVDNQDIEKNKIAALLSYIGILFVIPLIIAPDSKYARFHANQGLCLLIAEVIFGIVRSVIAVICGFIPIFGAIIITLVSMLNIVFVILSILGIIHAIKGEMIPLPIIGEFQILK